MPQPVLPPMTNEQLLLFATRNGGLIDARDEGTATGASAPLLEGSVTSPAAAGQGPKQRLFFGNGRQLVVAQGQGGMWVVLDPGNSADLAAQEAAQTPKEVDPMAKAMDAAQLTGQQLVNEQRRRELAAEKQPAANSMEASFKDLDNTLTYLQQQYAGGKISLEQMQRGAQQARTAFSDSLAGSTSYQRSQQRIEKGQIGAGMLNQRVSSGSGLINELLGNTMQAVKLGVGPGSFNPGALAQEWTTNLGGGEANYQAASAMLQGAVGATAEDPTDPAYWYGSPEDPGDPGLPDTFDEDTANPETSASGMLPGGTSASAQRIGPQPYYGSNSWDVRY